MAGASLDSTTFASLEVLTNQQLNNFKFAKMSISTGFSTGVEN
jgi:hypothetical protein